MKKNYKLSIFCCIALGFVIAAINIVLACIYSGDFGANIFTAVSGLLSCFATVILGVIALFQSKRYKQENDRMIDAQNLIFQKIANANRENNELTIRKYEAGIILKYENQVDALSNYLVNKANCLKVKILFSNYLNTQNFADRTPILQLKQMQNDINIMLLSFMQVHYRNDYRESLTNKVRQYQNLILKLTTFENHKIGIEEVCNILEEQQQTFYDAILSINNYKVFLRELRDMVMDMEKSFDDIKKVLSKYDDFKIKNYMKQ